MDATALHPRIAPSTHPLLVVERILRDREGLWKQISNEDGLNNLIVQMLVSSTLALACYGIVLGLSNSLLQAFASAVKLPILFLLTLAICLPTLYLFNLVFGSRLSVRQALATVLVGITVTSMMAMAFAPISLFFLLTAPNYNFFKILNVAILTLTGFIGLNFLVSGMRCMNQLHTANVAQTSSSHPEPPINMSLLYIWIVLYGFVGTQLGWTLRPFFGDPDMQFSLFRAIEGNFYVDVVQTLIGMFVN